MAMLHRKSKRQQTQVYVSEIYFYIYWPTDLYVLKTILKFSDKVYKSFVICKTVSKHAVIYAPSFGRLWFIGD